jgi:hypothetical protein
MASSTHCLLFDDLRATIYRRKPGPVRHRITQPVPDDPMEIRWRNGLQLEPVFRFVLLCEL